MAKKNRTMDCKEFAKKTPEWIADDLYGKDAKRFMEHMDNCEECREELHIQFLVKEGMERLESEASFNLDKELMTKVDSYKKRLQRKHKMDIVIYWMEAIAILSMAFMLALVIINKM